MAATEADRLLRSAQRDRRMARRLVLLTPAGVGVRELLPLRAVPTCIESRWDDLAASLKERFPKTAALMHEVEQDVLAFRHFPEPPLEKIWSANLVERVHEAIMRRTYVVGIVPNDHAVTGLVGMVLLEHHEHRQLEGRRRCSGLDHLGRPAPGKALAA